MPQRLSSFACLSIALSLTGAGLLGCDPPVASVDAATPDAFAPVDAGSDAFVFPDSCDMAEITTIDGVMGDTVSADFDTTMTTTRPRDLGLNCGNAGAEIRWAEQEVIEFHVPGTGPVGVQFTAVNDSTQMDFNTVIQVRHGDCRMVPATSFPPSCFDNASPTEVRSAGGVQAMGGDTLYFFVTGYSDPPASEGTVDEGTIHVEFTVEPNTPPTITSGSAVLAGTEAIITAEATDAEGPIAGFVMTFFTAMGQIDLTGDGVANDNDTLTFLFESVDRAAPMYTGHISIGMADGYRIAEYCREVGCTQFGLRVFDQGYAGSSELRVDVEEAALVGVGGTCDTTHICGDGLVCTSGMCAITPAVVMACAAAMDLVIPMPTTTATNVRVTGTIPAGTGSFGSTCGMTPGRERIWRLTVPAGHFDARITTDVAGTAAATDTVLYVRDVCEDPASQLPMGCNDDIDTARMLYHSTLAFQDLAEGDYYVFVETYTGATAAYGLSATLVPVLDPGVACDSTGVANRCATGTCPAGAGAVCP
jgi:hypothetical protein